MEWIIDRKPTREELTVIFKRDDYETLGGRFLVWDGECVRVCSFVMPPRDSGYYDGYWDVEAGLTVKAWAPLPQPPVPPNTRT